MILLGVNTVLFKAFSFREAAKAIAMAGYDGLEISAIKGMCEHLDPMNYKEQKNEILDVMEETGLKFLSMEAASHDLIRMEAAFEAAAELKIPVVNVGPGGKTGDEETFLESVKILTALAKRASQYGVTLCFKAHVGAAIHNTETTLRAVKDIDSTGFGVDMDPSHIYRSGEEPEEALPKVIEYTRHIHIRDCKGRQPNPGDPLMQACGRGDINLFGYFKAMVENNYSGPVCLEVIGRELSMNEAVTVAAESYGYMNACLKRLGAR
ncbi:MAG TPA: sugar phosphate isomerase/epimerase [Clostridia bacterium]|nr:sugar phosphate isomerase/epimerase [Clostridia bacterium]